MLEVEMTVSATSAKLFVSIIESKKDRKLKHFVNYHPLLQKTKDKCCPLPKIEEGLDTPVECKVFTALDRFYQFEIQDG